MNLNRLQVLFQRRIVVAQLDVQVAQAHVVVGKLRLPLGKLMQFVDGFLHQAGALERVDHVVACLPVVGLDSQGALVLGNAAGMIAAAQ